MSEGTHQWPTETKRSPWIAPCAAIHDILLEQGALFTQRSNLSDIPAVYGWFRSQGDAREAIEALAALPGAGNPRYGEEDGSWVVTCYPPKP